MKTIADSTCKFAYYLVSKSLVVYVIILLLTAALFTNKVFAQQYNYTQYTSRDGLAGSTVYGITQDDDGYLWFATNAGVSRFDGIHFTNYTVQDGLAANETLGIVQGTNNRLWFISFSTRLSFYSDGKIYNSTNNDLIRKIKINSMVHKIYNSADSATIIETGTENVIIKGNEVSCIPVDKSFTKTFSICSLNKYGWSGSYGSADIGKYKDIPAEIEKWFKDKILTKNIFLVKKTNQNKDDYVMAVSGNEVWLFGQKIRTKKLSTNDFYLSISGDHTVFLRNKNGFYEYDIANDKIVININLPSIVNEIFKDNEGEYWCSTNGQGVFKLPSLLCEHYKCVSDGISAAVINVYGKEGKIFLAANDGTYWQYDKTKHQIFRQSENVKPNIFNSHSLVTPYQPIFRKDKGIDKLVSSLTVKTIYRYGDTILAAAASAVYLLQYPRMHILSQIYKSRATCSIKGPDGNYYVGTLNGLYMVRPDGTTVSLADMDEMLGGRISFLAIAQDSAIWVATYGNGIVAIKHNKILPRSKLLQGNVCAYLCCNKNALWVATDNGVYKVNALPGAYAVLDNYNIFDGLASNNINCVYADEENVYAGTPVGLSVFKERTIKDTQNILHLNKVIVSGAEINKAAALTVLSHDNNNIRFEFAALSYKSGNNITYYYRLIGLDSVWHTVNEALLNYPSLPSGKYRLELTATNRFGIKSNQVNFNFVVQKRFWEKLWVKTVIVLFAMLIIAILIVLRVQVIKRKMTATLETEKRIHALEQMALRAQMNPHFIFNSLNSIQHFIIKNDVKGANKYLAQFGALIRQTLENSSKRYITLAEEISYLTHYIQLEQLQMAGTFEYEIITGADLNTTAVLLPCMVIQPFVENAIKHGLANSSSPVPELTISFTIAGQILVVTVQDNGPGILAVVKNSTAVHHSMGINITNKRIELLNSIEKMEGKALSAVEIEDLSIENKQTGTRVTLKIPIY